MVVPDLDIQVEVLFKIVMQVGTHRHGLLDFDYIGRTFHLADTAACALFLVDDHLPFSSKEIASTGQP